MFVSPMLLERVEEPKNTDDYITELKLDGIRLILTKFENKMRLYSRHNNEITSLFDDILEGLNIPNGTVLDGEIVVPGKNGHPNFEALMERFKSKKSTHPLQYCVFDIIYFEGKNISSYPLLKRKEILSQLEFTDKVVYLNWLTGNGTPYFNAVKDLDLEGIVQKKIESKYQINKRSKDWLKIINYKYADVYLTGISKKRKSFLLQSLDGQSIGTMEFVPIQQRRIIYNEIRNTGITEDDNFIFFNKKIKCNVKFRNWTSNGKLRIPSFNKFIS